MVTVAAFVENNAVLGQVGSLLELWQIETQVVPSKYTFRSGVKLEFDGLVFEGGPIFQSDWWYLIEIWPYLIVVIMMVMTEMVMAYLIYLMIVHARLNVEQRQFCGVSPRPFACGHALRMSQRIVECVERLRINKKRWLFRCRDSDLNILKAYRMWLALKGMNRNGLANSDRQWNLMKSVFAIGKDCANTWERSCFGMILVFSALCALGL